MLTFSGIRVTRGGSAAPTVLDIAVHTGKVQRFGGGSPQWWTVLHHLVAGGELVKYYGERVFGLTGKDLTKATLHVMLHDAHEAITGDVPRTWKPPELATWQKELDRRIYANLGIAQPTKTEAEVVRIVDDTLLYAEAAEVGPVGITMYLSALDTDLFEYARDVVYAVKHAYAGPHSSIGPVAPLVELYTNTVNALLTEVRKS